MQNNRDAQSHITCIKAHGVFSTQSKVQTDRQRYIQTDRHAQQRTHKQTYKVAQNN